MQVNAELAFPLYAEGHGIAYGLTKRELFAAMAMQGFCAMANPFEAERICKNHAEAALLMADALLESLAKGS